MCIHRKMNINLQKNKKKKKKRKGTWRRVGKESCDEGRRP